MTRYESSTGVRDEKYWSIAERLSRAGPTELGGSGTRNFHDLCRSISFFSQMTDSLKLNEILGNIYLFWVTSKNKFKISCNEHDIGFENSDPGPKVELQSERKWRLLDHSPCDRQLERSESRLNFCFLIEILLFFNSSNLYLSENLDLMNEIFGVRWRD